MGGDKLRIADSIFFSPKYKFLDIDFDDREKLVDCFTDRVEGFYLCPAEILNEHKYAFSAGLICVATIDFLAMFSTGITNQVKCRVVLWLIQNIEEFKNNVNIAVRFYNDFRNGLVYEGRIKNGGQFSYEIDQLFAIENEVLIVNPKILLKKIEEAFENYIKLLRGDDNMFNDFREKLKELFKKELELVGE